jgi:KDO2-lipid IV(A) lauroyltransferase
VSAGPVGRAARLRARLGVQAMLAGWELLKWLPGPVADRLGRLGGAVAYRRDARRRDALRANLARVRPDLGPAALEDLVRRGFDSYGRYYVEAFRMERLDKADIIRSFQFDGVEAMDEPLSRGQGVVAAIPHLGNWDVGGAWLGAKGYPAMAVAERLRPAELFDRFLRYRTAVGLEIVPADPGPGTLKALSSGLKAGKVVCLVADRDLGRRGIEVTMFGARTTLPAGPASLALRTGSVLMPAAVYQEGPGRWRAVSHGAVQFEPTGDTRADMVAMTRLLAVEFERLISAAPEQWHVLSPFWPDNSAPAETAVEQEVIGG